MSAAAPLVLAQTAGQGSVLPLLALVLLLVLVNAVFAGSEVALVSLRETQIQRLEQRGSAGRSLARLARDPNRFLSTIQIGITLAGFLASATATVALAEPLVEPLSPLGDAARPAAIFLVTAALTFVTLVFGELVPKRLALQRAESWSMVASRPLRFLAALAAPVVWVLTTTTDLVVRLLGGDPSRTREEVTEEELRDMVVAQPTLRQQQRTIIEGAFEIADRSVREVLRPRREVVAIDASTPIEEAVGTLVASGHSRAPVYRGDLDDVLGLIHLRDVALLEEGTVGEHVRDATILPETLGVLDALRRLQANREQMAVVINEHGGTEGVVSLEDLLEEIVGEIYDEFDRDLDPTDARGVERGDDGSFVMPGSYPMHDLVDLRIVLPEGDYTTVAGLVLDQLGRIPDVGEEVDVAGWHVEVLERRGNAVGKVRLTPTPAVAGTQGVEPT